MSYQCFQAGSATDKIDNKIFFQKNIYHLHPVGLGSKADFEKKIGQLFVVYQLLVTARKYDQPIYFFLKG